MKILYISNPNSPLTRIWVNWFGEHGYQVKLISDTPLVNEWPEVDVVDFPAKFNHRIFRYLIWEVWTRQVIRQWRPDVLHAHRVSSAGWLGAFTGFHPFVVTAWGSDLLLHPNRSYLARQLAYVVMRNADLVTADSADLQKKAIYYGANPSRCHYITWGVDFNLFFPGTSQELRNELGVGNAPVVFSPRGVSPIYNQDILVEAVPYVLKIIPNTMFLFRDFNVDIAYKSKLLKRISELGVDKSIIWIPYLSAERYAKFFRISNVVVSVPSSDSNPVTVLEAITSGVPVIVSNQASLREIIIDHKNGIIVPVKDVQSLVDAILEVLTNHPLVDDFCRYNLSWARENANRDSEMKKMESLYRGLLGQH